MDMLDRLYPEECGDDECDCDEPRQYERCCEDDDDCDCYECEPAPRRRGRHRDIFDEFDDSGSYDDAMDRAEKSFDDIFGF